MNSSVPRPAAFHNLIQGVDSGQVQQLLLIKWNKKQLEKVPYKGWVSRVEGATSWWERLGELLLVILQWNYDLTTGKNFQDCQVQLFLGKAGDGCGKGGRNGVPHRCCRYGAESQV